MELLCEIGASESTKKDEFTGAVSRILELLGEDPLRDGLLRTPERVVKSLKYLTSGTHTELHQILNGALFDVNYSEMVTVKDIDFFSLCEHHMLPFFGKAHIAYLPDKKVIGLSKIPRIVDMFGRRLQVQERLTSQIAEAVNTAVSPQGVGVVVEASHMCMAMRGVEKTNSHTVTSAMIGAFADNPTTRAEFLGFVGRPR